jgi:hypothetical protein
MMSGQRLWKGSKTSFGSVVMMLKLSTIISLLFSLRPFHLSQIPPKAKRPSSASETAHGLLSFLFSSSLVSGSHSKKKLAGMRQRRCFHGSRQAPLLSSLSERALMELKFAFGVLDQ